MESVRARVASFSERFGLRVPLLLAPMAGVDVPELSAAVANAGGMGACGALLMTPEKIHSWANDFRSMSTGPFQMNLWIPGSPLARDAEHEEQVRRFLANWGPEVPENAGDLTPPSFADQLDAMLEIRPSAVSSIMGLYPAEFVQRLKSSSIPWFGTATTVAEARELEAAGADVIVAQGMEAGGHRGSFDPVAAEARMVGTLALVPAISDAVQIPVVAAGGISDHRGVAAALLLGASAVVIGTGFLRCPEARIPTAWSDALAQAAPEDTRVSRVFSGRPGRSLSTTYVEAATAGIAPVPAPYPVQRGLTAAMRSQAAQANDISRMQAWAGQSAALATAEPAGQLVQRLWLETTYLLAWPARSFSAYPNA